jgi:SAM-dependent methyltransferase
MDPVDAPDASAPTRALLEELAEIKAHREWVIEGLRAHVENLAVDLARATERVGELERHVANLEPELAGARKHVSNLERDLSEREARLAEVEAHAANLERRLSRRRVRLAEEGMFPKVPFPRLDALFRAAEHIRSVRPDLKQRFPEDRAIDFWHWLMWHAAESDAELQRHLPPSPPRFMIQRVVGESTTPLTYRRGGLVDWWQIDACLAEGGFDPVRGGRLLDFGAGCGRILQFFSLYAASCRLVGCDVDQETIGWCVENLDFAEFRALSPRPPTPFADGEFDAAYAFSVFSHLPERLHLQWLDELARITRSGAPLVVTVHGRRVIDEIASGRRPHEIPSAQELRRRLPELEAEGFAFFPYERLRFQARENDRHFQSWDLGEYGNTFLLEPYIRERWTEHFQLVSLHAAPDDWQDYVVLRRR